MLLHNCISFDFPNRTIKQHRQPHGRHHPALYYLPRRPGVSEAQLGAAPCHSKDERILLVVPRIPITVTATSVVHEPRHSVQIRAREAVLEQPSAAVYAEVDVHAQVVVAEVRGPVRVLSEPNGGLRGAGAHLVHASVHTLGVEGAAPAAGSSGALREIGGLGLLGTCEGEVLVRVEELESRGSVGVVEASEEAFREGWDGCFSGGWESSSSGCGGESRQDGEEGTHDA